LKIYATSIFLHSQWDVFVEKGGDIICIIRSAPVQEV